MTAGGIKKRFLVLNSKILPGFFVTIVASIHDNTMITSVSFVLTWNLISNFPQTEEIYNMHEQRSNSPKEFQTVLIIFPRQSWYYKLIP